MAKEYFMPLFSVRASKSSEAHKQSLLMEKTHAKLQESDTVDRTKNGFPKTHIKPRKNNFVLVNSFPNPANVLKEGITEEEVETDITSSVSMTPSSSSYGITHLFRRSSKKGDNVNNNDKQAANDSSSNIEKMENNSTGMGFTKSIDSCAHDAHIQQQQQQPQQPQHQPQQPQHQRRHKHTGLRKLYTRTKKRKNYEFAGETSDEYMSPNVSNFINYNHEQFDSSSPGSPAFNMRNRSTSTSSSYFTQKQADVESFDTSCSTPYNIEDDDVCSINTTSTKRMKSDKRSNSIVSLVSIADSPVGSTTLYPTLRSVTSRNRLLSVSSPSIQPQTSAASSVSLSSTPYHQPQKSPSVQFHMPQMQATRSRSSSSAPLLIPLPSSSIRTSTPATPSFSTPSSAVPAPTPTPAPVSAPAPASAAVLAPIQAPTTTTSTSIPVTKGMNLDGYLNSLEAQRIQNIVNEQQQQILKQQLHHNDPIVRTEFVQAQAQVQTEKNDSRSVDPDMLVNTDVKEVEEEKVTPEEDQLNNFEDLAGLELMDLDLDADEDLGVNMNMNMNMSMNMHMNMNMHMGDWGNDGGEDSVVQEIDQLINLARLEEFVRDLD